jgi:hypothetical protein
VAQKFELKGGVTRVTITRGDGSSLVVEAGDLHQAKDDEDRALLEAHPDVKVAEKGAR